MSAENTCKSSKDLPSSDLPASGSSLDIDRLQDDLLARLDQLNDSIVALTEEFMARKTAEVESA